MARQAKADEGKPEGIQGEALEPIGTVERELTRPDGTVVKVEVPVYPPFRLSDTPAPRQPARGRKAPSVKRKRPPASKG